MGWLCGRQRALEKGLAARRLHKGDMALCHLSSRHLEGSCCPLAKFGDSRDKKRGKPQINFRLLGDSQGCPIVVEVYSGDKSDSATFSTW